MIQAVRTGAAILLLAAIPSDGLGLQNDPWKHASGTHRLWLPEANPVKGVCSFCNSRNMG